MSFTFQVGSLVVYWDACIGIIKSNCGIGNGGGAKWVVAPLRHMAFGQIVEERNIRLATEEDLSDMSKWLT